MSETLTTIIPPPLYPSPVCEGSSEMFEFITKVKDNYIILFGFLHLVGKIFSDYPNVKGAFLRWYLTETERKRISENFVVPAFVEAHDNVQRRCSSAKGKRNL